MKRKLSVKQEPKDKGGRWAEATATGLYPISPDSKVSKLHVTTVNERRIAELQQEQITLMDQLSETRTLLQRAEDQTRCHRGIDEVLLRVQEALLRVQDELLAQLALNRELFRLLVLKTDASTDSR